MRTLVENLHAKWNEHRGIVKRMSTSLAQTQEEGTRQASRKAHLAELQQVDAEIDRLIHELLIEAGVINPNAPAVAETVRAR